MSNVNHNFLPFEVTELLPKVNPYLKNIDDDQSPKWIQSDVGNKLLLIGSIPLSTFFSYLRDAWTILEALTWLEEQGYYLNVFVWNDKTSWDFTLFTPNSKGLYRSDDYPNKYKFPEMKSRTEAYITGIKHCLELINQNKNEKV